jgi:AcrR family transcriptional regulator
MWPIRRPWTTGREFVELESMTRSTSVATRDPESSPKREAIVEAATKVFLADGYGAAGMDAIAREAGVSKQTIYNRFGSKEALFGAIIRRRCDDLLSPLSPPESGTGEVRDVLTSLARKFTTMILSPTSLSLYRVLIGEAFHLPQLAAIAYRSGPARAWETLASYLAAQSRLGVLEVTSPRLAAEQFFGMLAGQRQLRALLGLSDEFSDDHLEKAIDTAVASFLRAHRARGR